MDRENVQRYRKEAERLRMQAETMHDTDLRRQYLDVAEQYDRLANTIARVWGAPQP